MFAMLFHIPLDRSMTTVDSAMYSLLAQVSAFLQKGIDKRKVRQMKAREMEKAKYVGKCNDIRGQTE